MLEIQMTQQLLSAPMIEMRIGTTGSKLAFVTLRLIARVRSYEVFDDLLTSRETGDSGVVGLPNLTVVVGAMSVVLVFGLSNVLKPFIFSGEHVGACLASLVRTLVWSIIGMHRRDVSAEICFVPEWTFVQASTCCA
jgi:hypothetical protein